MSKGGRFSVALRSNFGRRAVLVCLGVGTYGDKRGLFMGVRTFGIGSMVVGSRDLKTEPEADTTLKVCLLLPPAVTTFASCNVNLKASTISQNSAVSSGLSVQAHEVVGSVSHFTCKNRL